MSFLNQLKSRLAALFRKRDLDADMADEMRSHIEMRTQENIEAGMSPEEARFAALRQFGWTESIKETCRDRRGVTWLENLAQDIRFGARQLRKSPGFTLVAVLSLALGISSNLVVLGWVNSVLLNALPGTLEPDRLAVVVTKEEWGTGETMSYPNLHDLGAEKSVFAGAAGSDMAEMHVRFENHSEWAWAEVVTANYFELLGVRPVLGQLAFYAGSDTAPGSAPQVVLGEKFWRRFFNGDAEIVGKTVVINHHSFTVIGVADAAFKGIMGGLAFDFWVPISMYKELGTGIPPDKRGWSSYHTVVRLKPGVGFAQADAAAGAVGDRLKAEYPNDFGKKTFGILPFWKSPWGGQALFLPLFQALGIAAGLVMLLVVANLGNLLLARSTTRQGEMAVRLAVGASKARLVRQLLSESLLLASLGGVLAILLSIWGIELLEKLMPATHLPVSLSLTFDWRLAGYALGIASGSSLLFGLAPALQSAGTSLAQALSGGGRSSEARGARMLFRRGLVVVQLGLALVVVVSAVLCMRSFSAARLIPLGFDPRNVWLASFRLDSHGYNADQAANFFKELQAGLLGKPGVVSVAFGSLMPLGLDGSTGGDLEIPENPARPGENRQAQLRRVTPGYFSTLRTPILKGREFRDGDDKSAPSRIIINQTVAERLFPNRDPLGLKITIWGRKCEIIGVAAAGRYLSLGEAPAYAAWVPAAQWGEGKLTAVIRMDGDLRAAERLVAMELKRIAPMVDAVASQSLENYIAPAFMLPRSAALFMTGLGVVALVLAVMGIYGVMSFQVDRRSREMGIRMALGAGRGEVFRLILSQAARLSGAGLLLGLIGAGAATRLLGSILIGVDALDPSAFVFTTALITAASLGACWFPANRAARVDPTTALRSE